MGAPANAVVKANRQQERADETKHFMPKLYQIRAEAGCPNTLEPSCMAITIERGDIPFRSNS